MAAQPKGNQRPASTHVALLRGINLAGKNRLAMKDLLDLFADAGCADARAYIQSGNIVFGARAAVASRIATVIEKKLEGRFGFSVPVVVRTAEELRLVVKQNPFVRPGVEVATLHVAFLADAPSAAQVAALDPDRSPPDEFVVRGREIYLRCPNGLGRTKLTNLYFDSKLATTSTVRNWKTVLTLLEMTGR